MKNFKDYAHNELLSYLPTSHDEVMAFLSAVSKVKGSIEIVKKRLNLCIQLDTYDGGVKIVDMFKSLYPAEFELSLQKGKNGQEACILQVPVGFSKQVLEDFGLMRIVDGEYNAFVEGVPQDLTGTITMKKAYFKGLFFACGSVYVPSSQADDKKKDGYHFELQLDDDIFSDDVMEMLSDLRINTRMSERGEHKLIYVKDKDDILKILLLLDLNDSAMQLKRIIDEREIANSLNRAVICETANLDKTFTAASKHLLAIGELKSRDMFDSLPDYLKDTAQERALHPEASLQELADILGVTKSCLNHRLRKLVEIAST